MRIYVSGIAGTGMGPLALLARGAGFSVCGSDLHEGPVLPELSRAGISEVLVGKEAQGGEFLQKCHAEAAIDWFVYTSALPADHAELVFAREAGMRVSKRDEFLAWLVDELNLRMVAVAGTHGKTTTTSMLIWACSRLGLPAAWAVGTTLPFANAASYRGGDKYFIYEADEYDRNFLAYRPWISLLPFVSYDHPDCYPTVADYEAAFEQFKEQSQTVIEKAGNFNAEDFALAGEARRTDASLAAEAVAKMASDTGLEVSHEQIIEVLNQFPGTGRRFEKICDGLYSDYAHHPEEIQATLQMAREEAARIGRKGVVAIYEPHQNVRQHEVFSGYHDAFLNADSVIWLPTYLVRENPSLRIFTPEDFVASLDNKEAAEAGEVGEKLKERIAEFLNDGKLVVLMTAGPADEWLRRNFSA